MKKKNIEEKKKVVSICLTPDEVRQLDYITKHYSVSRSCYLSLRIKQEYMAINYNPEEYQSLL